MTWVDGDGCRVFPLNRRVGKRSALEVWVRGRGRWRRCGMRRMMMGRGVGWESEIVSWTGEGDG